MLQKSGLVPDFFRPIVAADFLPNFLEQITFLVAAALLVGDFCIAGAISKVMRACSRAYFGMLKRNKSVAMMRIVKTANARPIAPCGHRGALRLPIPIHPAHPPKILRSDAPTIAHTGHRA